MRAFVVVVTAVCALHLLLLAATACLGAPTVRLAVIGDYGKIPTASLPTGEVAVAESIAAWGPDGVLTLGDNNYPRGEWTTIDDNIGRCYGRYIAPLNDSSVSAGAPDGINRFWPVFGNHDGLSNNGEPYLRYLRGVAPNMSDRGGATALRYYTVRLGAGGGARPDGPVQLFALNSNDWEPDGIDATSRQAMWLKAELAKSTAPHRVVTMHHLPFSSNRNDPVDPRLRWPFKEWGASVTLHGHSHSYERMYKDGFYYLQNGLGGTNNIYGYNSPRIPESQVWFNATYGFQMLVADDTTMTITFRSLMTGVGFFEDTVTFPAVFPAPSTTAAPTAVPTTAVPTTAVPTTAVPTTAAPTAAPSVSASPPPPAAPSSTAASASSTASPTRSNNGSNNENANGAGVGGKPSGGGEHGIAASSLGVGILVGVVACVMAFGCFYAVSWYRRTQAERREEALGMNRRTFSITPHRRAGAHGDGDEQQDMNSVPLTVADYHQAESRIDNM